MSQMTANPEMLAALAAEQREVVTDSETYSRSILGPVAFTLSDLKVEGTSGQPAAPDQSPYIIAEDEVFNASVKVTFNKTPLSSLLMCLGTKVTINFHFEGQGRKAPELDTAEGIITEKGKFEYTVKLTSIPSREGLKPGLYEVSATAEIGPVQHECSQFILGYGYISDVRLQVYPAV